MKTIAFLVVNAIFWIFHNSITLGDLVDIINLGFIIWVFVYDHKKHKEEKINDYRMTWYRSFDTTKNLENFRKILDSTKTHLVCLAKSLSKRKATAINQYAKKSFETFNQTLAEKRELVMVLSCISEEQGKKIARLFIKFQDELSNYINDGINKGEIKENEIEFILDGMEQELTDMLYKTGLQFV